MWPHSKGSFKARIIVSFKARLLPSSFTIRFTTRRKDSLIATVVPRLIARSKAYLKALSANIRLVRKRQSVNNPLAYSISAPKCFIVVAVDIELDRQVESEQ
jgi:hypothetical protein